MGTTSTIKKCYTRIDIHSQKSDFAHWQTQPYQVRLATLEQIRQEYHRWRSSPSKRPELLRGHQRPASLATPAWSSR